MIAISNIQLQFLHEYVMAIGSDIKPFQLNSGATCCMNMNFNDPFTGHRAASSWSQDKSTYKEEQPQEHG